MPHTHVVLLLHILSAVLFFVIISVYADEMEPRSWHEAHQLAAALVSPLSLDDKIGIVTGSGLNGNPCTGNTHSTLHREFPSLCLQDGPLGVRSTKGNSVFPAGINAAASFDKSLMRQRGVDMGQEFHGKGIHVQLGPAVDIQRVPSSGRSWESFGEDPYLSGVSAVETIQGVQSQGVIAVVKHYNGNNQETNRGIVSSDIDDRTLHELYHWPFARAVEAGVGGIMCAYNRINGTFACENDVLLNQNLKSEMGFQGWVVTDWLAGATTIKAANAGLDMVMPGGLLSQKFGHHLANAVKTGQVTEARVTDMVQRIVASWYKLRQDENYPKLQLNKDVQGNHKQSIRALGAASIVLLKNSDQILPFKKENGVQTIAVIGNDAYKSKLDPNLCYGHFCHWGTLATGGGSGSASFPYLVSPYEGILQRAQKNGITVYSYNHAINAIMPNASVTVVFVAAFATEAVDRPSLALGFNGKDLINKVAEACENTVVVMHTAGPVDMLPWAHHPHVKAILWAGLPGQESGNGLADVLFGDVNPSGRLPYTIARDSMDYPAHVSKHLRIAYTENLLVGYKWFDARNITPLFEFGFGLSYTTFDYSGIHVHVTAHDKDVLVRAQVTIRNTGPVQGAEVVQAYISFPSDTGEPPKLLRGFEKILLDAGAAMVVPFSFRRIELSIWDTRQCQWVVPHGEYTIHIGASSRDLRQHATLIL